MSSKEALREATPALVEVLREVPAVLEDLKRLSKYAITDGDVRLVLSGNAEHMSGHTVQTENYVRSNLTYEKFLAKRDSRCYC